MPKFKPGDLVQPMYNAVFGWSSAVASHEAARNVVRLSGVCWIVTDSGPLPPEYNEELKVFGGHVQLLTPQGLMYCLEDHIELVHKL